MALPREPRQKMINFMYLVLTAMLALNVSSEILNAFKVVDGSLLNSNSVIDNSSKGSIDAIEAAKKDPGMAEKAAKWKPVAEQAMRLTQEMSAYIDGLKDSLKRESGYNPGNGDTTFKEDDLDAATRLMDTHGKGKDLHDRLEAFAKQIVEVVPADQRRGLAKMPIDLTIPRSTTGSTNNNWTTSYFHMTPTVAALTMLSKFQNDVKRSGNLVVDYCQQQLGKVVLVLDKFVPFTSQNSQYLLPGQEFQLQAGLGAFSSQVKPTVTINGQSQVVNDEGYVDYKEMAGGGGTKTFNVVVNFKDPNTGESKTINKTVSYTVGQASGSSIFLEKMNVVYIGVDNPLTISTGSAKRESGVSVTFSGGSIRPAGGDRYIAVGSNQGDATINVTAEGKTSTFPIRVKRLPNPTGFVGTYTGGAVPAAAFRAMGGVSARLESEFDVTYNVEGYIIGGYVNGTYQEVPVTGPRWNNNPIVTGAKPGSLVSIFNLRAKGPDGTVRKLPEMAFRLQ
jgi:gliding motility-associated protein GldM